MKKLLTTVLLAIAAPTALLADEVVVGGFYDIENDSRSLSLAYHSDPVWTLWNRTQIRWAVGTRFDDDQDFFVGAGISTQTALSDRIYFSFRFMPGYYEAGRNGNPLGGPLSFWSEVGFGYRLTDSSALLLTYDHFSNAFIYDRNQGVDAFGLAYAYSF